MSNTKKADSISTPSPNTPTQEQTKSLTPWFMLTLACIFGDQVTKWLITQYIDLGTGVAITPFFNLIHVLNPGAAFSFLANAPGWQRYFLSSVAIVASMYIIFLMRSSRGKTITLTGLSLILAGALGNLIDRLLFGAVVDFLDFYYQTYHFPAFNLADSCITVGAIFVIFDELFISRRRAAQQ